MLSPRLFHRSMVTRGPDDVPLFILLPLGNSESLLWKTALSLLINVLHYDCANRVTCPYF